jgi:DNA-binding XRE family transcriptional regulator
MSMMVLQRGEPRVPAPTGLIRLPYVRAWRAHALRQQQDVAHAAHVSKATMIRAEAGKPVTVLTAARIALELGVSVRQLQEEEPPQP